MNVGAFFNQKTLSACYAQAGTYKSRWFWESLRRGCSN